MKAQTQIKPLVTGAEEQIVTTQRKYGRFLGFKTSWEEIVGIKHIANHIIIRTDRDIKSVFVNGKEFINPNLDNK